MSILHGKMEQKTKMEQKVLFKKTGTLYKKNKRMLSFLKGLELRFDLNLFIYCLAVILFHAMNVVQA